MRYVVNEGRSGVNALVDIYLDERPTRTRSRRPSSRPRGSRTWRAIRRYYGRSLLRRSPADTRVILVMHTDPKPGEDEGYPNYVGNIDYLEFGLAPLPE